VRGVEPSGEARSAEAKEEPRPVVAQPGSASVQAPAKIGAGARFEVRWQGPDSQRDYVTVVPEGAEDAAFLDYAYTQDGSPVQLTAPDCPGKYEVRYVFDASMTVLARASLEVEAVAATLSAPSSVTAGSTIEIRWTGPSNDGDYVTIVRAGAEEGSFLNYAYTRDGNPLSFQAPDDPGAYELRYVTAQESRTLARQAIAVAAATATVSGPASAAAGERFQVRFSGPDNEGDYVTIVATGADEGSYLDYVYTRDGSPAQLEAPAEPGAYELRYVTGQTSKTLARAPIAVR